MVRVLQDGKEQKVYIYSKEYGRWGLKQVGKSCLAEFTHGLDAEVAAAYISAYDELIQGDAVEPGNGYKHYVETLEAIEFVSETVRHFGYIKADNTECFPTKNRAWEYIMVRKGHGGSWSAEEEMREIGFNEKSDSAIVEATEALKWISKQEAKTEYMHNLKTVCSMKCVEYKNIEILASLIPTYRRWMENEKDRF